MKTKFYGNTTKDERRTLRMAARYKLAERKADILTYMNWGVMDCDIIALQTLRQGDAKAVDDFYERNGSLDKYWSRFTNVSDHDSDNNKGYLCLHLTDTVPIEEIRVYEDPTLSNATSNKIEYIYMDWNSGVSLEITGEGWAKWLRDIVIEMGLMGELV